MNLIATIWDNILLMIDNFFQQQYHNHDQVYTNQSNNHHIYLGNAESATDSDFHLNNKIKTIVTAAKNMDHIIIGDGIKHIKYPLLDGKNQNIIVFFNRFYQLVEAEIKRGSILVHCVAGISRSATLVISYIMRKEKMTFKEAIAFVRKSRSSVLPNLGFERQLKQFQQTLRIIGKNSRNYRRSEVRTSESGKRQISMRLQMFPLVRNDKKGGSNIDKLSEKDIKILKIYHNGKKNHPILANKLKTKIVKTQMSQVKDMVLPAREKFQDKSIFEEGFKKIDGQKYKYKSSGRGYTLQNQRSNKKKF